MLLGSGGVDGLLVRAMDVAALRHRVLANNVANAETPGFKAGRVEFESLLQRSLAAGGDGSDVVPQLVQDTALSQTPDGNNVDIDAEMAALGANNLFYSALARSAGDQLGRLRAAISEGRR